MAPNDFSMWGIKEGRFGNTNDGNLTLGIGRPELGRHLFDALDVHVTINADDVRPGA